MNWLEKDTAHIWHPFSSLKEQYSPLMIKKAKDCTLTTEDDSEIIDAVSSWWTNIHGHANEELANAIYQQSLAVDHVIFAGFTHRPAIELAENLIRITENNFSKVFFSDDGSTAVEVGLKIALQYWNNLKINKTKVLALEGAYHGDTFGSMSLAGKSEFFKAFNDKFFPVHALAFPTDENIEVILSEITKENNTKEVACLILEPLLQGSAGMKMYSNELLAKIFKKCKEENILIIADEVLTGFGRTGNLFASIHEEIKPDIMALSKGITGGILPLGVTLINEKVIKAFDTSDKSMTFYHGHSYTGNAIICAVANKSIELLETQTCINNRLRINKRHLEEQLIIQKHSKVSNCRVLGTVLALDIKTESGNSYFNSLRDMLYQKAISKGVLLRPLGNTIYVLPPYIISDNELSIIYKTIKEILNEI
jgi:adenosylmethionine---8-amino-7-oxononanoate aminotransferase